MRIVTHEIYRDFTIILIIFAVSSDLTISLHFFVTEKARSPCACDAVSQSAVGARLCRRSHSHTNATAGSLPHSAVAVARASSAAAGPIAFAVIVPGAGGLINCVAVSECIADIIGSAAHGDNDNDDDDDQEGDADAERAADTASAETGLGGLGSFV